MYSLTLTDRVLIQIQHRRYGSGTRPIERGLWPSDNIIFPSSADHGFYHLLQWFLGVSYPSGWHTFTFKSSKRFLRTSASIKLEQYGPSLITVTQTKVMRTVPGSIPTLCHNHKAFWYFIHFRMSSLVITEMNVDAFAFEPGKDGFQSNFRTDWGRSYRSDSTPIPTMRTSLYATTKSPATPPTCKAWRAFRFCFPRVCPYQHISGITSVTIPRFAAWPILSIISALWGKCWIGIHPTV